jgi:DNA-directed RNA polymerase specialized sigma24 family protein
MPTTSLRPRDPIPDRTPLSALQAAFRDVHTASLHGFAFLLTLGDATLAAQVTAAALAEGEREVERHRNPDRAAAWLRARVVRSLRRRQLDVSATSYAALEPMGIARRTVAGIAALTIRERAALIAVQIERFDPQDTATILGVRNDSIGTLLRRARHRYLVAASAISSTDDQTEGTVRTKVRAIAEGALA